MVKIVLTTKVSPSYDDLPEVRYHFPKTYLRQVESALHDWIIYYEPRRTTRNVSSSGGRQSYFATACIDKIEKDTAVTDHYYAFISQYLEFDRAVPFAEGHFYYESILKKDDGSTNKGAFGRAVRSLPDREYEMILQAGYAHTLGKEPRLRPEPDASEEPMQQWTYVAEPHVSYETTYDLPITLIDENRPIIQQLVARPFRDRAFSSVVKSAYYDTCAMTGIKIINGGGRSEVQAAHIRPISDQGPDSIRNGVALSSTMHWMFDRGLVSIDDDYKILLAKGKVPDTIARLVVSDKHLILPDEPAAHPHPHFLSYHRTHVYKG
ncbi:MAG: HNH endonuclease [Armatimonadota bacterium]